MLAAAVRLMKMRVVSRYMVFWTRVCDAETVFVGFSWRFRRHWDYKYCLTGLRGEGTEGYSR